MNTPPDKEDLELYITEFFNTSEKWTSQGFQSIERSFDLSVRNGDREFNLFLSLTTLSAAFLAIVPPLIKDSFSISLILTIILFLFSTLLGIIILWATIKRDQRLIDADAKWEHSIFQDYLKRTTEIRSDLYAYKKSPTPKFWQEISFKIGEYLTLKQKLVSNFEARQAQKEQEYSSKVLKLFRKLFWITFILALGTLVFWFGHEMTISFYIPTEPSQQTS